MRAAAIGGLLALVAMGVVLAVGRGGEATVVERADALAAQLRCPDCQGLSVADSQTPAALEIRRQIGELIVAGAGDADVRAHFTARYGEWILLAPSSPLVWLVPFVAVLGGLLGLATWLVSRRRDRPDDATPALTAEQRRRLHEEADALDA